MDKDLVPEHMIKFHQWIVVDKSRKIIACGSPRNRELKFIDDVDGRIMLYGTKGRAESSFRVSGYYTFGDVHTYIEKTYGIDLFKSRVRWENFLEAIEVEISEK